MMCAGLHGLEKTLSVEMVSLGFFFFNESVCVLCYLDSSEFCLFSGFPEAKGQSTGYFWTLFPVA